MLHVEIVSSEAVNVQLMLRKVGGLRILRGSKKCTVMPKNIKKDSIRALENKI